ncbi:hypothetical protein KIM372_16940 [Bombiscardovia nodaiensis]|uniref:Transposase n=1 Tax=Bombiscardovia nodaiensis TaxID=2932181 RepID=A0ABM8BA92_9BIFI|nr:hypothetical protein KIM372_16940 [Bombiscardovia nodaiensis]
MLALKMRKIPIKAVIRRTAKAPVGANAARSGNKWSPGLKHGPTRYSLYGTLGHLASSVRFYALR